MGIKTLFRIFTPENKAAVAAVFILIGLLISVCYLFLVLLKIANFQECTLRISLVSVYAIAWA